LENLKIPAEKPKRKNKMSVTKQSAIERERERERERKRTQEVLRQQQKRKKPATSNYAATTSQCSAPHASITNPALPRNSDEPPNPSFYVSEKTKKTRSPEREGDAHRQRQREG
jgi:hypothetical protein